MVYSKFVNIELKGLETSFPGETFNSFLNWWQRYGHLIKYRNRFSETYLNVRNTVGRSNTKLYKGVSNKKNHKIIYLF